jgi:hypothetical protein
MYVLATRPSISGGVSRWRSELLTIVHSAAIHQYAAR